MHFFQQQLKVETAKKNHNYLEQSLYNPLYKALLVYKIMCVCVCNTFYILKSSCFKTSFGFLLRHFATRTLYRFFSAGTASTAGERTAVALRTPDGSAHRGFRLWEQPLAGAPRGAGDPKRPMSPGKPLLLQARLLPPSARRGPCSHQRSRAQRVLLTARSPGEHTCRCCWWAQLVGSRCGTGYGLLFHFSLSLSLFLAFSPWPHFPPIPFLPPVFWLKRLCTVLYNQAFILCYPLYCQTYCRVLLTVPFSGSALGLRSNIHSFLPFSVNQKICPFQLRLVNAELGGNLACVRDLRRVILSVVVGWWGPSVGHSLSQISHSPWGLNHITSVQIQLFNKYLLSTYYVPGLQIWW